MVNLSVLNRFLLECLPVSAEEPVVKVNDSPTNQVIAKERVVVPRLNLKRRSSREGAVKLEQGINLGVGFIKLILVTLRNCFLSASDEDVRVTEGTDIA